MKQELVDRLISGNIPDIKSIEAKYPKRKDGQIVTRMAPSPTGFMHIGNVWTALLNERLAHTNNGIFYIRIEDTDQKRLVENAVKVILETFQYCDLENDEGLKLDGKEYGNYSPYTQSQRKDIYKAYIKELLKKDLAYPSFMSSEELEKIREEQTKLKVRTGIYGLWARERNLNEEQIINNLEKGKPFVIYFKSNGNSNNKIVVEDVSKGKKMLPENDVDIVILKNDGLPTYHFAHVIDDHLMGTTHVVRTDEWFISTPLHIQLFQVMGWQAPQYVQPAPIQKLDNGAKRKLSKRKDPEANFQYYIEKGYPKEVVINYLMNLLNSNYEDWQKNNLKANFKDFPFDVKKVGVSGSLLDFTKLNSMCKDFIATLSAEELYERLLKWAKIFDLSLTLKMEKEKDKFIKIFEIERKNCDRVRKDYGVLSEIYNEINYFFDFSYNIDNFKRDIPNISITDAKEIIQEYIENYNENYTKEEWFNQLKEMAQKYNYCIDNKEYKPELYKGKIADFVAIFRYLITGKKNSPDLYSIMQVLGKQEIVRRLEIVAAIS